MIQVWVLSRTLMRQKQEENPRKGSSWYYNPLWF